MNKLNIVLYTIFFFITITFLYLILSLMGYKDYVVAGLIFYVSLLNSLIINKEATKSQPVKTEPTQP